MKIFINVNEFQSYNQFFLKESDTFFCGFYLYGGTFQVQSAFLWIMYILYVIMQSVLNYDLAHLMFILCH